MDSQCFELILRFKLKIIFLNLFTKLGVHLKVHNSMRVSRPSKICNPCAQRDKSKRLAEFRSQEEQLNSLKNCLQISGLMVMLAFEPGAGLHSPAQVNKAFITQHLHFFHCET